MIEDACEAAAKGAVGWISEVVSSLVFTQEDFKRHKEEADGAESSEQTVAFSEAQRKTAE